MEIIFFGSILTASNHFKPKSNVNTTPPTNAVSPDPSASSGGALHLFGRAMRGCGRLFFSRKIFYLLGSIPVIVAIVWLLVNYQGDTDWKLVEADMAKRGMSFAELNLPRVCPASENFAMHPVFAPAKQLRDGKPISLQNPPVWNFPDLLGKYTVSLPAPAGAHDLAAYRKILSDDHTLPIEAKTEPDAFVLTKTSGLQVLVDGINEAATRPHTQWAPYEVPVGAVDEIIQRPFSAIYSVFEFGQQQSDWLSLRAQAQLAAGQPSEARQTILAMIHLGEMMSKEERYSLVSCLVDIAMQGLVLSKLEHSLQSPGWTEADLTVIANALAQNDIATMPAIALRKELLWGMKVILEGAVVPAIAADLTKIGKAPAWGDVGKYVPSGWLKHNAAVLYEAETKHYLDPAASDGGVFGGYPPELTPRNLLHGISIGMAAQICPCVSNIIESARQTQFLKDKLRQRCLLAAHQMSTGQPATVLTALVPHFLMQIKPPHSPILIPNPTPP